MIGGRNWFINKVKWPRVVLMKMVSNDLIERRRVIRVVMVPFWS